MHTVSLGHQKLLVNKSFFCPLICYGGVFPSSICTLRLVLYLHWKEDSASPRQAVIYHTALSGFVQGLIQRSFCLFLLLAFALFGFSPDQSRSNLLVSVAQPLLWRCESSQSWWNSSSITWMSFSAPNSALLSERVQVCSPHPKAEVSLKFETAQ